MIYILQSETHPLEFYHWVLLQIKIQQIQRIFCYFFVVVWISFETTLLCLLLPLSLCCYLSHSQNIPLQISQFPWKTRFLLSGHLSALHTNFITIWSTHWKTNGQIKYTNYSRYEKPNLQANPFKLTRHLPYFVSRRNISRCTKSSSFLTVDQRDQSFVVARCNFILITGRWLTSPSSWRNHANGSFGLQEYHFIFGTGLCSRCLICLM